MILITKASFNLDYYYNKIHNNKNPKTFKIVMDSTKLTAE